MTFTVRDSSFRVDRRVQRAIALHFAAPSLKDEYWELSQPVMEATTAMAKRYRAAAIGSTGKGNFGHGLDTAFKGLDGVDFVAVADDNPAGLKAAAKKTGVRNLYGDYREMLAREKLDLVGVGPSWLDRHAEMVTAAARAGCH